MPSVGVISYDVTPLQGVLANAFLILINALFLNVKLIAHVNQFPEDSSLKLLNEDEKVFDFIIVGAGTAGCALANRLSENEQFSVLLIEAGNFPQPSSGVPAFFPTFMDSGVDSWQYIFEKNKGACQAFNNKQCRMFRGKLVGGTSAINNMHYIRGLEITNTSNEIYNNIEYYSEDDNNINNQRNKQFGDIVLEKKREEVKVRAYLRNAYQKLGFNNNTDRSSIGFTETYLMSNNGERFHAARAFLTPLKSRSNFFLSTNTLVEGVVLNDPKDKRAKGVNVTIDNVKLFLQARKELILTAGAINNAKLLLLSGIGDREYLEKRKIPVVLHMPGVGKNLNFHLSVPIFYALNSSLHYEDYTETDLIRDTFEYVMFRIGNLSHTGIHDFVTFMSTEIHPNIPNIAVYHYYFKVGDRMLRPWLDGLHFHPRILENLLKINDKQNLIMFLPTLLRPKSLSEIKLNDTHFRGIPKIIGNFFTDHDGADLLALISAFSKISNLQDTQSFAEIGAEIVDIGVPDCRNYKFCTAQYVKCYIKNLAFPTSNVAGSLKRGPECDNDAVVKEDFEVRYIRCLRVCDASILLNPGLGNTVASDAMMAVHLSEILKQKWIKDYASHFNNI